MPDLKSPYFYEGGLNLTALFPGQALPCFSTFISNTRTSQADSAVLKDFASGAIDTCGSIKIKKDHRSGWRHADVQLHVGRHGPLRHSSSRTARRRRSNKLNTGVYHVGEGTPLPVGRFDSVTCGVGDNLVQKSGANLTITLPPVGKVECTYLNKRDTGSLTLSKVLTGGPAGYTGPFTINYDCNDGTAHDGSVSVNAGTTSAPITGIPTGTQCTISETPPTAPTGYTFGTPSFSPSAVATIATKGQTVNVQTTNTLTRDTGSFKITKQTSNPDGATLPAAFTGTYNCGTGFTGNFSVANGGSQTINGIPTGNTCSVVETVPAPITGYTWGTPTYTPASIVIATKAQTFEIVIGNSITRDKGSFKITKQTSNPDGATLPAAFTGTYNCGTGFTGNFSVANGGSQTINGIPTGNTCSVVETVPAPITGYTWGTPTYTPASIVIATKAQTFEIVIGNSITRDRGSLKLSKALTGGPEGYTGPFTIHYVCDASHTGDVQVNSGVVPDDQRHPDGHAVHGE